MIIRRSASLAFLFAVFGSQFTWAAGISCSRAGAYVEFALKNHLIFRGRMTDELARRTSQMFTEDLLSHIGQLTYADAEAIRSIDRNTSPHEIAQGLTLADCSYFEKENEVLKSAYRRIRTALGREAELTSALLKHRPTGRRYDDTVTSKSVDELRTRILDDLKSSVDEYSQTAAVASAARFVAHTYLTALDQFEGELEDEARVKMLKAFMLSLDPHSGFYRPFEYKAFSKMFTGSYEGLGIILGRAHPYGAVVGDIHPDSPVARDGQIHKGDVIVSINSQPIALRSLSQIESLLHAGGAGSRVVLEVAEVKNKNLKNHRTVSLVRSDILRGNKALLSSREVIKGKTVLTLKLKSFYTDPSGHGASDDMRAELSRQMKIDGGFDSLVLDLRGNPGGILQEGIKVAGLFLTCGNVAALRDSKSNVQLLGDPDSAMVYSGPLVVAINNLSASASEIVAGTLQAMGRALIVGGAHSYGKGTAQEASEFNDAGLILTVSQFFTAKGESVQNVGVASDIFVPGPSIDEAYEERNQKYAVPSASIGVINPPQTLQENADDRIHPLLARLKQRSFARLGSLEISLSGEQQLREIQKIAAEFTLTQ